MLPALECVCTRQTPSTSILCFHTNSHLPNVITSTSNEESDLGLCTSSVANRMPLQGGDFRFKNVCGRKICRNLPMCGRILFASTKLCTDLDLTLLYILELGTHGKISRKNKMLALGVCFPQTCSSAGRMCAASRSR